MLADLAEVGAHAEAVFEAQFPKRHGGGRRAGPEPATKLVEQLIDIYGAMRAQYPRSGPAPAFGRPLLQFVRAGLAFAVSARTEVIDSDGRRYRPFEVAFLEVDLPKPSRITDKSIQGVFQRRRTRIKAK